MAHCASITRARGRYSGPLTVAYAAQLGLSAAEYEPGGKAASEIRHVYKSICRVLDTATAKTEKQEGEVYDEATA